MNGVIVVSLVKSPHLSVLEMPRCVDCNKGQARLNQPGDLCKECFDKVNNDSNSMSLSNSQMNGASSLFSMSPYQPPGFGLPSSNDYNCNDSSFLNTSRHTAPQIVRMPSIHHPSQSIQTHSIPQNIGSGIDANTPVAQMTAGQMLTLIQSQTKPL